MTTTISTFVPHKPWSWSTGTTVTVSFTEVSLEALSILFGIPLVDLSIEYEPWLVRGLE